MCLVCGINSPSELPFIYCKECCKNLDARDPTMDIAMLRLLVGENPKDVLARHGYDDFVRL